MPRLWSTCFFLSLSLSIRAAICAGGEEDSSVLRKMQCIFPSPLPLDVCVCAVKVFLFHYYFGSS
jgi:hypothetical protein